MRVSGCSIRGPSPGFVSWRLHVICLIALLPIGGGGCGEEATTGPGPEVEIEVEVLEVLSVAPLEGTARGSEEVMITGRSFGENVTVWFGDNGAVTVERLDEETLLATTPPMMAGAKDVTVEASDGEVATLEAGYRVLPLDLRFVEAAAYAFPGDGSPDARAAAIADLDVDGDLDLAIASDGGPLVILRNDGYGNFVEADPWGVKSQFPLLKPIFAARDLAAADFDMDGCPDLFMATGAGVPDRFFAGDCQLRFVEKAQDVLGGVDTDSAVIAVGDLDGDGGPDLVVANTLADAGEVGQNRIYLNDWRSGGSFRDPAAGFVPPGFDEATASVAMADVDGDGDTDLIVGNTWAADGANLRLLLQVPGRLWEAPDGQLPSPADPVSHVAAGDIDMDGDVDLVVLCPGSQDRLYVNDGSGHYFDDTLVAMPVDMADGTRAVLADLDRDGTPEIVIANHQHQNRLYVNDGTGRYFDHTPLLPIGQDPTYAVLALTRTATWTRISSSSTGSTHPAGCSSRSRRCHPIWPPAARIGALDLRTYPWTAPSSSVCSSAWPRWVGPRCGLVGLPW